MLCVAMMLSVMVMGAGAAFTDQDKIVNEEAVDMISALGIVDGYEDDSFQPEKNIERGEAAKMIAVMLNGGKDAVQNTSVSSFNDVLGSADAWANKYIEYGVSKGILAGVGGDRFAPASNVTGTQLAKMLLVSLGYDADKEGYLDDTSWAVNVNTDAASVGLYAGIESIDMNAALTRDNAAQMIWNALQANTVKYSILGGLTETNTTLLADVYGANTTTGILTDISYNHDTGVYTYTIDANGIAFGSLEDNYRPDIETFTSSVDYSGLFAQNVKVLANGDDEALMIRTDKGGVVVEATIGDIGGINTHRNTITVDGQKYTLDNEPNDPDDLRNMTCYYNQYYNGADWDAYDQYAFVGIDQDGGGDIDVLVVYPFVVLRTETVLNDTFVAREIKGSDASLTVGPREQDRGLIVDVLFGGRNQDTDVAPLSAEIEYDDIALNGTVEENGYVMVVPAEFTAQDIDTYTVLDINSGVANSLNTRDNMVTFGTTEYDGNLVNVVVPVSTISLGETYGFVEVNGYLFIVDGNNIGPVKDEYVVVTKTALAPQGVDKLWETTILKTDGTTETVDVYVSLNDQHYGPEVGSLYTVRTDLNGNYELIAVPGGCYGTDFKDENTNFDVQQAYKNGATLNNDSAWKLVSDEVWDYHVDYVGNSTTDAENYNLVVTVDTAYNEDTYYSVVGVKDGVIPVEFVAEPSGDTGDFLVKAGDTGTFYYAVKATLVESAKYELEMLNLGLDGVYDTNTAGGYFGLYCTDRVHNHETNTVYQIEDDAVIFVYNRMMDEYSVVKGSDLENIAVDEISWAFTGATAKVYNGTPTVDLGYVAVDNDPDETLVYAYVDSNPIRGMNTNGNYVLTVDVILDGGQTVTLTSQEYASENDRDLMRLYAALTDDTDGIFQLIVDGSTLIDIKDYQPAVSHNVTAALYDGVIMLDGAKYFVDADTEFIPTSGNYDSIAEIPQGVSIDVVVDDDNYVIAVIA